MTVPFIEPLESRIAPAVITLVAPTADEGTGTGTTEFKFNVHLDAVVNNAVTVHAKIKAGGTATTGVDFVDIGDVLITLNPGQTNKEFTVLVNKDDIYEARGANETFIVELSDLSGAGANFPGVNADTTEATANIRNDDAKPTLSIEKDVKVDEGDIGTTNAIFRVKLSNPADRVITFDWATALSGEPNAANLVDFNAVGTTMMTIDPGQLSSPDMTVVIVGDTTDEREEEFFVRVTNAKLDTVNTETLTITDGEVKGLIGNDEVFVKITGSPSVVEGDSGSTPAAFTVSLPAGVTRTYPITVSVKVSGTGATPASAGTDVVAAASVVIPAGQNSATLNIGVFGDLVFEGDEAFLVTLDNVVNAAIDAGNDEATGTILAGADPRPSVSILPPGLAAQNEGSTVDGRTDFQFRARLSQVSSEVVKVVITLGGTASADDYVIESQTSVTMLTATTYEVTIPAGQQETPFIVKAKHDAVFEADETIIATISTPANATLGTTIAQATIRNDEDVPRLKVVGGARAEGTAAGDTAFGFTVQLVDAAGNVMSADKAITFDWQTIGGTALAGSDFTAQSATGVTIPAGQTEIALSVPVVADSVDEPDEKFSVEISNALLNGATGLAIAQSSADLTIQNDDLTLSLPATLTVTEDQAEAVILVQLSAVSTHDVTVSYDVQGGTAFVTSDFTVPAQNFRTLTIAAGATTGEIRIPLVNNGVHERPENFTVSLVGPVNAVTAQGAGVTTVTINDDEAVPELIVTDFTVTEGNTGTQTIQVIVSLKDGRTADRDIAFDWAAVAGTAATPGDFTTTTTTATILANSTEAKLTITIVGDTVFEGNENFLVQISNARFPSQSDAQPVIFDNEATVTITDNESAPTLLIEEITDSKGAEGNVGDTKVLKFRVRPSVVSDEPIKFTWGTAPGGTAVAGDDYTSVAPIEVTIPANSAEVIIEVPLIGDVTLEPDESVFVTVSGAKFGAAETPLQITDNLAEGTIRNDEGSLSIDDLTVIEGDTGTKQMVFTVSFMGAAVFPVTVFVNTQDGGTGGAISGGLSADFVAKSAMLTFNDATSQTFIVDVNGDATFEGDETFRVVLTAPVNAVIADGDALATITDNEAKPGIRIEDARITEGDSGEKELRFRVALTNRTATQDVSFKWEAKVGGANPAEAGTDFIVVPVAATPNTILRGQEFVELVVKLKGDALNEADETFIVELSDVQFASAPLDAGQLALSDLTATGTIQNDDLAVRIAGGAVTEGDSGTVNRNFDISIPQAVGYDVTVTVEINPGSAKLGQDYNLPALPPVAVDKPNQFSVTIPAGQTTATLAVPIIGDILDEANETITARLVPDTAVNAIISSTANSATVTITDDDTAPTLSIADAIIVEGDSGEQDLVFTVTLSAASGQTVSVLASTAFGTAVSTGAAADFTALSQTLTFLPARPDPNDAMLTLPAETSKTFTVKVKGDALDENDETFTVALTNAAGATPADATATGTITDNDAQPVLSVAGVSLDEGGGSGTTPYNFIVSLSAPSGLPVTFSAATVAGTATAGGTLPDYTHKTQLFTFDPGQTSKTFTVLVNRDGLFEENETFSVALSNVVNAGSGALTASGTIRNDDTEPVLSIGDASVTEGDTGTKDIEFTVSLSAASATDVTFDWAAVNGTTDIADYTAVTTSPVTIPAGQTTATIKFTVAGDTVDEADENFFVNVSNALLGTRALTITDGQGEGKIFNDDLSISAGDVTVTEGDSGETDAVFRITLSAASAHPVTVHYRTQDNTAVSTGAAADYTAIGDATVTFAPGEVEKFVTVKVRGDENYDLANAFRLTLSQPEGARILDNEGIGTITDDDTRPMLAISDVTRLENADAPGSAATTAFAFHITLSAASDETIEVSATTFDGTALAGQDFNEITGQRITFAPGETDKTVTVTVLNDAVFEAAETFKLRMHNPLRATLGADIDGDGTIQPDDDAQPKLKVIGGSVVEGDNGERLLNFTVTRTGATGTQIKFKAEAKTDGADDATAGADFALLAPDEITLEPTETSKTVSVRILGDAAIEGDEKFTLEISDVTGATIDVPADAKATGTILDDDAHARFLPVTASVAEGNANQSDMVFIVALSGPAAKPVTITYTVAAGTAGVGTDFQTPTVLSLTIPAGASTGEIRVPVTGDATAEEDETLTVTLTGATNGALDSADLTATGTILNDDAALRIGDVRVLEGQTGTRDMVFTVTLEDAATFPVTVHFTTQASATDAATIGVDFGTAGQNVISGDLTFAPGETSRTIVIPIIGDSEFEGDETFRVVLSDAKANGVAITALLDGEAVGTINDDDALLSINDVSIEEGDAGTKTATFTVTLLPVLTETVTVTVSTMDGTATSAGASPDFVAKTETLTFAAGQTTKTFTVVINGDLVPEALSEMFSVVLSDATGAAIADDTGVGAIFTQAGQPAPNATLDDPLPTISIADATIVEGDSGTKQLEFTVSLTQASGADVTFTLASANGTANGADFTALPATTFTIPAGEKTLKVSIPILGDTDDEADETFTLTLTNAATVLTGLTKTLLPAEDSATGTILNDERVVSIGNASVAEASVITGDSGDRTLNIPVSIPSAANHPITVTFTVAAGTATVGTDFTIPTVLTATIPAGQTTVNVPIIVKGDAIFENDETLTVTLTGATGALLGTTTGTGTITNDDAPPTVTIVDSNDAAAGEVTVNEGQTATFTVKLATAAERDITLRYVTVDGSAEGDDYAQSTLEKTLVIPAGQTEGQITVSTIQDTRDELDETFQIRILTDATNGPAADVTGTATIRADQNDLSTLSIADARIVEGNSGTQKLIFTVSRSGSSALLGATVNYTTADGSAKKDGGDYTAASGVLEFAPGVRTKTIEVDVFGDAVSEIDETFLLSLTGAAGAKLGDSQAFGTIQNDELSYELVPAGTLTVTEEDGTSQRFAEFEVRRTGAAGTLTLPGAVTFATELPASGVIATAGTDYTTTTGTISFQGADAAATTQTATQKIRVPIIGDALLEGDETFVVRLTAGVNGILSANDRATVTITDNDGNNVPNVIIGDALRVDGVEGAAGTTKNLAFVVKLVDGNGKALAAAGDVEVTYSTANGTATDGSDFTGSTDAKLIIPAGQTQGTILIPITGDGDDEADETFSVNLAPKAKLSVPGVATPPELDVTDASATGTITNDDLTLTIEQLDAPEGNANGVRTFTVKLSQASSHEVKFKFRTQDGTAKAGEDFKVVPTPAGETNPDTGERTIPANVTEFTFDIAILGDVYSEGNESFTVFFSDVENALLEMTSLTTNIFNDDAAPTLSIGDASIIEGDNGTLNMVFTVTLAGATREAVTVDFATSDGTAKAGGPVPDYVTTKGTRSFDASATGGETKQIIVPIVGDNWKELTENFTVTLSNALLGGATAGVTISDASATGDIIDDGDATLGVFVTETRGIEGTVLTFSVQTTAPAESAISFKASTRPGTANTSDFTAFNGSDFTIAAGASSVNVTVETLGDTTFELTEFLFLDVNGLPAGAQAVGGSGGTVSARGYLLADDLRKISDREFEYVDVDGDIVHVRFSKGSLAIPQAGALESGDLRFVTGGTLGGRFLELINLSDDGFEFEGANIIVSAEPQVLANGEILGDGRGDVGLIFAAVPEGNLFQFVNGVALGKVQIDGDLGRLFAGSTRRPAGVSILEVGSFGVRAQDSNSPASGNSIVLGPIGKMIVHGDVGSSLSVIGDSFTQPLPSGSVGRIGSLVIEGALKGGSTQDSGRISYTGGIGTAVIGSIEGGTGQNSGSLRPFDDRFVTRIGKLTVTGGIEGGGGKDSGFVEADRISALVLGKQARGSSAGVIGNLAGGSGERSGLILVGSSMGSVFIHGDVIGGTAADSGKISVPEKIGAVTVTGSLRGGQGAGSGAFAVGQFTTVAIQGDVLGGSGANSGALSAVGFSGDGRLLGGDIVKVTIGKAGAGTGSITGGAGQSSGGIFANGRAGQVIVHGSITGGTANFSGGLAIGGALSKATVYGDLIGGSTGGTALPGTLVSSGFILADDIVNLLIKGDVKSGTNNGTGMVGSGAIRANDRLGTLRVDGDLTGNATAAVIISGRAGIGSVSVGGNVDFAEVLAGYAVTNNTAQPRGVLANAGAGIEKVIVAGALRASSIVAGVFAGADGMFGTADDDEENNGTSAPSGQELVARIASVIIGQAGAPSGVDDDASFGIVAEQVVSVKVAGVKVPLLAGADNDREVAVGDVAVTKLKVHET